MFKYLKLNLISRCQKYNGDWGLGIGPNPQAPSPNPHEVIPLL